MDFILLSGDTVTAQYTGEKLRIINYDLLPLYLKRTGNIEKWLEIRAIDTHRANSRLLKKALRLAQKDDMSTVISVNAVTITDNYWIKPIDSKLSYNDVRFDNDYFSNLALTGSYGSFNKAANSKSRRTPELTNIGSYEKCWKLIDGEWWMYKRANHDELFSELFVYLLGKRLNFNMAEYKRGKGVIKTKDFTNNASVNFEPAYSIMDDDEEYIKNLKAINDICPNAVGDYVKMLFLDTVCANPDRHTFNYGFLRDIKTGEILGLAPNFDNNMALISRGYPRNTARKKDVLVQLFGELIKHDERLRKYVPDLNEDMIAGVIDDLCMRVRRQDIIEFVMNGYNAIKFTYLI